MLKDLGQRTLIMGIINVTPDSFSGDGVAELSIETITDFAQQMVVDGADMLDIGGESTRPGSKPISMEEELKRVLSVISAIHAALPAIPLSIDTTKAEVAKAALGAGAIIVNDVTALHGDKNMAAVVAAEKAYVILMHNRTIGAISEERIGGQFTAPEYIDVVDDVAHELAGSIQTAKQAGIAADKIIADPGIGFGKTVEQNCALINHVTRLKEKLGCPILLGPSRKSFIGKVLDVSPEERLEGTAAAVVAGVLGGADIIRVHDVGFMARTARMAQAIAKT